MLVAALILGTVCRVSPKQFGLRMTGYVLMSDHFLPSGVTLQVPLVQYTHKYQANTQTITLTAGGCRFWPTCDSTKDQNPLRAEVIVQYRVKQDLEDLGFHQWAMEGFLFPDGYWLLTDLLNVSANAVLGQKTLAETVLSAPRQFSDALYADFTNRLKLNNVPVEVESLELREFNTFYVPIRTVAYGVSKAK